MIYKLNNSWPLMVCFSSGKGGVGKTSLALNTAMCIAQKNRSVLVVDGDLGLANIDVMLGLSVETTIKDVLAYGGDPLSAVVYPEPNLGILPASSGVPELVTFDVDKQYLLAETLKFIATHFELVIVDTAAGIGPSVLWFNSFVHKNVVILTPDPTSITDAYALMKVLSQRYQKKFFHILINQVTGKKEAKKIFEGLAKVCERFLRIRLEFLGLVPKDKIMSKAIKEQVPVIRLAPDSNIAKSIDKFADKILLWCKTDFSHSDNSSNLISNNKMGLSYEARHI